MFEDLQTWLLFINLRYLFLGGCFQTQAAQKGWNQWIQWPILTMSKYKYEPVWSSMKQYEAVIFAVEWVLNVIPSKKKMKFLIPDRKKNANNWKVHQFLSRASREVTLAFPPSFTTSMRRRPSATWRNGDVMRWGERQTKPGRWVKWVKSSWGPKICWSLMDLLDYFWAFVLQENQRHPM